MEDEPLQMPPDSPAVPPIAPIKSARKRYIDTMLATMRAPDGSYEEGFSVPGMNVSSLRAERTAADLEKNNPLSLDDENPWKEWFAAVELRKTILQDVERTFPDIGYFRDPEVQYQLTNILYLYSASVPDIGYRQGMHELLAPLYHAVDYDSIPEDADTKDPQLKELCSRTFVAADAWALFLAVMKGVSRWYEWREPDAAAIDGGYSLLTNHVQLNADGKVDLKPYVAPIVQDCNHLQGTLLRTIDPILWKKLQSTGIEPQIYGIMQDAMVLWDGLFAVDPTFQIVQWICIAMLLRIRNQPTPASDVPDSPHHLTLLLRHAVALQHSPNPSTGASIVVENRNLLNIPLEIPDPPPAPMRRRVRPGERGHQISPSEGSSGVNGRPNLQRQHSPMESIARNLLDRGESMGINKTFLSAVSELKRNLPDLAASLTRAPQNSPPSYSAFPLSDERPAEQTRSRFESEREVTNIRSLNQKLGKSVSWIVDTLLQDEEGIIEPSKLKAVQDKKREALESLSYVRDVLNGGITDIEEERLWSEQDFRRRSKEISLSKHTRNSSDSFPRHDNQVISKPLSASISKPPPVSISEIRGARSYPTSINMPSASGRSAFTSSRQLHSHSTTLSASVPGSSPPPRMQTQSAFADARPISQVSTPTSYLHTPRGSSPVSAPPSSGTKSFTDQVLVHDPLGVL
ncbi:hypothetical protein HWV62_32940 [Athelia sp. TMB]|nr:hypothetical protein HWV62_32940 [Athelia sp. TMB]